MPRKILHAKQMACQSSALSCGALFHPGQMVCIFPWTASGLTRAAWCREGKGYVLSGRKWWASGAMDPRCKICIFMGKTDPSAATHKQQSMILVPMDAPGVTIVRPLTVYGYDDAPHGHAELLFEVHMSDLDQMISALNVTLSSHGRGCGSFICEGLPACLCLSLLQSMAMYLSIS